MIGAFLTWPIGVYIGKRAKTTKGGVPMVPSQRFVHDFPNLEPVSFAKRRFKMYLFATCMAGGLAFAFLTVNPDQMKDPWYARPDLKPFPAMVPKEELSITERTALATHY